MHNIKTLQKQDAYCKCKYNTLHIPSIINNFITKDDTLFKIIQDADKSYEALVVPGPYL